MEASSLINIAFKGTTTSQTKDAYTMYEMEVSLAYAVLSAMTSQTVHTLQNVSGSMLEPFTIFKRYSDFHALHHGLLKLIKKDSKLCPISMPIPDMPQKTSSWLGKNSKEVIDFRRKALEEYLRTLLKADVLCKTSLVMDFLGIPANWISFIAPQRKPINRCDVGSMGQNEYIRAEEEKKMEDIRAEDQFKLIKVKGGRRKKGDGVALCYGELKAHQVVDGDGAKALVGDGTFVRPFLSDMDYRDLVTGKDKNSLHFVDDILSRKPIYQCDGGSMIVHCASLELMFGSLASMNQCEHE